MSHPKILIVDDDKHMSLLIHKILETVGYEVREETHSYAALASAREFHPDLVLLDVNMPGKDGGTLRAELAREPEFVTVPVLFVSGILSPQESSRASVVPGSDHFLAKPFFPRDLLAIVRNMLLGRLLVGSRMRSGFCKPVWAAPRSKRRADLLLPE